MAAVLNYPGKSPGATLSHVASDRVVLENAALRCTWPLSGGRLTGLSVAHHGDATVPRLRLGGGRVVDLSELAPQEAPHAEGDTVSARFCDAASGLEIRWSARLADDSNALIQSLVLTAAAAVVVEELVFIDAPLPGAVQVGEVDGSVVVRGEMFMAVEHPLARNRVDAGDRVRCSLSTGSPLAAGQTRSYSAVIGVVPPGQLRRGFLYYLERRRVHPYRQFLHYNNWYDVVLSRPAERMTESEALAAIAYYGQELVRKRGVTVDAVAWDDGWDDFNTLWDFHKGFPDGFRNLMESAGAYGISQGVWMSPNGGYATAKARRIAHGAPLGYETNDNGFAMGGPNYRAGFREACLRMIRENGVVFFKFDGMGEGGSGSGHTSGTSGALSDDIQAILELSRELHEENPDVYVSATAGTWASPFWLLYADSVWRQGGDTGHHGAGNTRQQWLTYRDMFCHNRVVQAGPLYPLNSLMLHGIVIGNRPGRAPAGMAFDEKSVADEIWSFFGSGTCLQELYVSPGVPTAAMLDALAAAAKWARRHENTLVDTHWVGGNPGEGEVYGWASWQPGTGIVVLRNPSPREQTFALTLDVALELPAGVDGEMAATVVYPAGRSLPGALWHVAKTVRLAMAPFETLVLDLMQG